MDKGSHHNGVCRVKSERFILDHLDALSFWPDFDVAMIQETIAAQLDSGKIPTCILPYINREDDIDITEYFILRVWRHYSWWNDTTLLSESYSAMKKAVEYLVSRDLMSSGIPAQASFWADWKDVSQVSGRLYAPHFELLWLTTLEVMYSSACILGDSEGATQYLSMLQSSKATIFSPIEDGGLWDSQSGIFRDVWYPSEGWNQTYMLMDQSVGVFLYQGMEMEKKLSITNYLLNSEGSYGVRETYPYIQGWGDPGEGNYHDGGIWPWLSFVDITNNFLLGSSDVGTRRIEKLGLYGLIQPSEIGTTRVPFEYLNGDTGLARGNHPQAWDAAAFLVPWKGIQDVRPVSFLSYEMRVPPFTYTAHSFSVLLPVLIPSSNQKHILVVQMAWVSHSKLQVVVQHPEPQIILELTLLDCYGLPHHITVTHTAMVHAPHCN